MKGGAALVGVASVLCVGLTACDADTIGPPAPPAKMSIVSGDQQTVEVGTELPAPLVVRVTDASGAPVAGYLVNFRVVSGGGSVFAGSALTNSNGEARERWTLGTSTQTEQRVEARAVDAATGAPIVFAFFTAITRAAAPSALTVVSGDNQEGAVGEALAQPLVIRVVDRFSNPVPSAATQWSISSGTGTVTTSLLTNDQGLASNRWVIGPLPGMDTVSVMLADVAGVGPIKFAARARVAYSAIATGTIHACAIRRSGGVDCWGQNLLGQLGIGAAGETCVSGGGPRPCATRPWPVSLPERATAIATGDRHTCALTISGALYCWGQNRFGELGVSTTDVCGPSGYACSTTPRLVSAIGAVRAVAIAAGNFTCVLTTNDKTYCWGSNDWGQLGKGDTTTQWTSTPQEVVGGHVFTRLTAGVSHACGLTAPGEAFCWGSNFLGELGLSPLVVQRQPNPVATQAGLRFTKISAGGFHTCGVAAAASYCWGENRSGQLGGGFTSTYETMPIVVAGNIGFATIWAGYEISCGANTSNTGYCWGDNRIGNLGLGYTSTAVTQPAVIAGIRFAAFAPSDNFACGLSTIGYAYCWGEGDGREGQLGQGTENGNLSSPGLVADPATP